MANRFWYNTMRSLLVGATRISGSWGTNGVLAPTFVRGKGFTVTRTGVGQFTILLADQYAKLVSVTVAIQLAAVADAQIVVGPYVATSKTLIVTTLLAGVASDFAVDPNNRVNFDIQFSISSVD